MKKFILILSLSVLTPLSQFSLHAAEKLKVGSTVKVYAGYYLPILAGDEKGFWRENGLEAEWVPFAGGAEFFRALAGGHINFGVSTAVAAITSTALGVPVAVVGELITKDPFLYWVQSGTPFKDLKDLSGVRVGVDRFGASSHAFGQAMAKALGIDVKFVAAGGLPELLAAFRVGRVDVTAQPLAVMARMKVAGEVRSIGEVGTFLPREWMEHVISAHKEFVKKSPDTVRRGIRALLQSTEFLKKNPGWALEKVMSRDGLSESGARLVLEAIQYSATGRVDKRAVENIKNFLAEYGVIPKDRVPATEELFVPGLTG